MYVELADPSASLASSRIIPSLQASKISLICAFPSQSMADKRGLVTSPLLPSSNLFGSYTRIESCAAGLPDMEWLAESNTKATWFSDGGQILPRFSRSADGQDPGRTHSPIHLLPRFDHTGLHDCVTHGHVFAYWRTISLLDFVCSLVAPRSLVPPGSGAGGNVLSSSFRSTEPGQANATLTSVVVLGLECAQCAYDAQAGQWRRCTTVHTHTG
ncbi:hypothetical protein P153DRAFT_118953 [Dothidotthia symphoricarpi CBS 119687]|uniref:Uncharacterized protein n=1 Tax=Dothidotthia symphoricarpi CBS 119687 TaxID=1392245 RepID=A0A6A6A1K2_9PLEO|nr:uncharacterized protein P153DRAFT_118953 [Dothidotthia symphoricarpi CBS 119687]KAF2125053.1 hypothetical protein P153DRAFT_118953 [Dothidotthia symphoricarpi CBS 119687]